MLRNYLATALRHLARNTLYSAISIIGLAVGLASAILVGLVVRNQLTFDRFIDGYQDVYVAVSELTPQGHPPMYNLLTHGDVVKMVKLDFSEVTATTRIVEQTLSIRHGDIQAKEKLFAADPNLFEILPLPVLHGDANSPLQRPDAIVISVSKARKYFGQDDPTGELLQVEGLPMVITAVIEDLPIHGTHLTTDMFFSGRATFSELARIDGLKPKAAEDPSLEISVQTYLRLAPDQQVTRIQSAMPGMMQKLWSRRPPGLNASMQLVRIDQVHLFEGLSPGVKSRLAVTVAVGALILLLACVNFVNLSTARSSRRAVEVGIRKVSGAGRGTLIAQFLGESLVHVALAVCFAVAIAEFVLPNVNAFLSTGAVFEYWRDPGLLLALALGAIVVASLAGMYPAVILSAFRPAAVLKGTIVSSRWANIVRQGLVVLQFAILIVLLISAGVVYKQQVYATNDALRVDTDYVLVIEGRCQDTLKAELQALPGVKNVACSGWSMLTEQAFTNVVLKDGTTLPLTYIPVDPEALDFYSLKPIAGRFFTEQKADECMCAAPAVPGEAAREPSRWVINETAVKRLGFSSPEAAIGQIVQPNGEIIGVVPDFSLSSVKDSIDASVYVYAPTFLELLSVRLGGRDLPETLAAIDNLWAAAGSSEPIKRFFLDDYIDDLYRSVLRQAQAFGTFSLIAILLACLGLFGLSAAVTEHRTKEIGVRKAMGVETTDIVRLLLWQFSKPVLCATLIAWPAGAYLMNRWLQGFAYHVGLDPWLFVLAAGIALLVALLTVANHCIWAARGKPAAALRTE